MDGRYGRWARSRLEPETSCSCLKSLQSLCQAIQMFLLLHMMKIRDLNLLENLERHHLSPLEWHVLQQSLRMDYIFKLKSRRNTKMSVHLIHMHMAAQGFAVGTMILGMGYSMYQEFWVKPKP